MIEHVIGQWRNLEPSGLGHELLREWAPWVRDDAEGGHSWAVKPRVDRGYHGDPPSRVNRVDKIVARMKLYHRRYYDVVAHYYLGEKTFAQISMDLQVTQGWARTMLLAACGLVEMQFRDS